MFIHDGQIEWQTNLTDVESVTSLAIVDGITTQTLAVTLQPFDTPFTGTRNFNGTVGPEALNKVVAADAMELAG